MRFLTDGRLILEVPISAGMHPQEFTIDLAGVIQLRIEAFDDFNSGNLHVGIGNPVIK